MPGFDKTKAQAPRNSNKRPTHFVCFPLADDNSVRQLSETLGYFKAVTTADGSLKGERKEGLPLSQQPSVLSSSVSSSLTPPPTASGVTTTPTLQLIPPEAHRPPGTFHLTLGVMDLSEQHDFDRALHLLQDIDYTQLLIDAGRSKPTPTERRQTSEDVVGGERETGSTLAYHFENDGEERAKLEAQEESRSDESNPATSHSIKPLETLARTISPPLVERRRPSSVEKTPDETTSHVHQETNVTPLTLTLAGLGTFPRPNSSRVFYAHPHEPTGRLLPFAQAVQRQFRAAGLITETRPLVLHATVANLVYVRRKGRQAKGGMTVDARGILQYFNKGQAVADTNELRSSSQNSFTPNTADPTSAPPTSSEVPSSGDSSEFIWAEDILVNRIRICKMGADKSDRPGWGLEYPAVGEKVF